MGIRIRKKTKALFSNMEFNSSKPFYLHDFAVSMPLRPEREICK